MYSGDGNGTVDYKEMYKKMFQASEQAINLLIAAQRECEEMYISAPEGKIIPLDCGTTKKEE